VLGFTFLDCAISVLLGPTTGTLNRKREGEVLSVGKIQLRNSIRLAKVAFKMKLSTEVVKTSVAKTRKQKFKTAEATESPNSLRIQSGERRVSNIVSLC